MENLLLTLLEHKKSSSQEETLGTWGIYCVSLMVFEKYSSHFYNPRVHLEHSSQ